MNGLDHFQRIFSHRHSVEPRAWLHSLGVKWTETAESVVVLAVLQRDFPRNEASLSLFAIPESEWPAWLGQSLYDAVDLEVVENDIEGSVGDDDELRAAAWLLALTRPADAYQRSAATIARTREICAALRDDDLERSAGTWLERYAVAATGRGRITGLFGAILIRPHTTPTGQDIPISFD